MDAIRAMLETFRRQMGSIDTTVMQAHQRQLAGIDFASVAVAFRQLAASRDTSAILKAYQRQMASMDTTAILKAYQRQMASMDTTAILKAYQRQMASIDFASVAVAFRQLAATIDSTAILKAYQVSVSHYIASSAGRLAVERATEVLARAEEPVGAPPPIQQLDEGQFGALSQAIVELGNLDVVPDISKGDGLEWLVTATVQEIDEDRGEPGPTAVQTAVMTMVIVSAVSTVIASSPALLAVFGLLSIPITLWPFIKSLVASLTKTPPDDDMCGDGDAEAPGERDPGV